MDIIAKYQMVNKLITSCLILHVVCVYLRVRACVSACMHVSVCKFMCDHSLFRCSRLEVQTKRWLAYIYRKVGTKLC